MHDLSVKAPASFSEQAHLKGVPYFEQIFQPIEMFYTDLLFD